MAPPFGSGPPWAPGGFTPQGVPPPPPPIAAPQPQTKPYVGNSGVASTGANVSSFAFGVNANAGDGLVLILSLSASVVVTATATYGGVSGDTFNVSPALLGIATTDLYALWLPKLTGTNPTITVNFSVAKNCSVGWMQIVGGNPNWFIDQINSFHVSNLATITPYLQTTSPNDLIVGGWAHAQAFSSVPAGYKSPWNGLNAAQVANFGMFFSTSPVAAGTLGPGVTFASSGIGGVYTLAIRTGTNAPTFPTPPIPLPIMPPGAIIPVVPFPGVQPIGFPAYTIVSSEGIIVPEADYFPTAQTATFTEGTITSGAPVVPPVSQAGGTGSSKSRRKPRFAREVFQEEMARLERQVQEATQQRIVVEERLSEVSPYEPVPEEIRRYIVNFERALRRAQQRESAQSLEVPVYIRIPVKSEGVKRVEAYQRLQTLAKVARYREELARERLRKVRERIDEEAATYFMQFLMWDD